MLAVALLLASLLAAVMLTALVPRVVMWLFDVGSLTLAVAWATFWLTAVGLVVRLVLSFVYDLVFRFFEVLVFVVLLRVDCFSLTSKGLSLCVIALLLSLEATGFALATASAASGVLTVAEDVVSSEWLLSLSSFVC